MGKMNYFKKKGDPYVLMTGLGLVVSLAMVVFIVVVILARGLGFFWPGNLLELELKDGQKYLGEFRASGSALVEDESGGEISENQTQLKIGNRDLYGRDFIWIKNSDIVAQSRPRYGTSFERWEYGYFYGQIQSVQIGEQKLEGEPERLFGKAKEAHRLATKNRELRGEIEEKMTELMAPLTELQREISLLRLDLSTEPEKAAAKLKALESESAELESKIAPEYEKLSGQLQSVIEENQQLYLSVLTAEGQSHQLFLDKIVRFYQPNRMNVFQKSGLYLVKMWEFLAAAPRESNTEGGVFPAIFGTVLMVLLMSIAVVPLGVMAALYLNEYAKQGTVIRLIRLSVNNLAGVPSIVFGIFGLGFFIYTIGGTLDQLLFSQKLPEPTFGTGGIFWASLTLALLTLPVVVVATEEGILAVPRANKEGALALGATRWQMVRKIVLPNAMPGILTGLILAISRGAGEVAPLMITGVVKLAPSMPLDATFPFLHLDRKFMHLGFHIYDVGFQSPNVEAAKPMVYSTALLLITIVVFLNLMAIYFRNRMKKRYKSSTF
ncbi:phosphate ABC transporter, permease protein PstA [candidate division KSB1 bacterium RBG_16_48_16]|nr:MAG: phosphate ABC transporter, permease protein PstA [candidate division KSB1 bacterium RBG_16_48_16]